MKNLKIMLPLVALLMFALPNFACDRDKSADHSDCKMHKHKQHGKKDQNSTNAQRKLTETEQQQQRSEIEQDKNHSH
jgi:Ni/Co efflux regulator RcnB